MTSRCRAVELPRRGSSCGLFAAKARKNESTKGDEPSGRRCLRPMGKPVLPSRFRAFVLSCFRGKNSIAMPAGGRGEEAAMKRCQRVDGTWKTGGDGRDRWHALFCAVCRGAREADRRLARGARALREPSVPPALRGQILSRLGLPAEENA